MPQAGVVMIHCAYGIFHLARPAGARPPASSAGYQTFSAITDLAVLPLYTYGCLSVRNASDHWGTLLNNESLMNYFLPSLYYTLFAGAVLHLVSLVIGLWLALKFRQITRLPPDLNPLEDNLTSRHQKKLSVATTATFLTEDERRLSTPLEDRRRSGLPYDDVDRPPSVPFHATRSSPRSSFGSADLPPRQYQITPGNSPKSSPRNSATAADLKRMSAPPSSSHSSNPPAPPPRSPWRNSHNAYAEIPTQDLADFRPPYGRGSSQAPPSPRGYGQQSRPGTARSAQQQQQQQTAVGNNNDAESPSQPRPAKFTESWYATESLFNRTHARNRAAAAAAADKGQAGGRSHIHGYEAIHRRYDLSDSDSESDYGNETATAYSVMSPTAEEIDENDGDLGLGSHPNPLRANPSLPSIAGTTRTTATATSNGSSSSTSVAGGKPSPYTTKTGRRPNTPFVTKTALSEIDLNDRRVSGGNNNSNNRFTLPPYSAANITDEMKPSSSSPSATNQAGPRRSTNLLQTSPSKRYTWAPRDRISSIQPEADFYSKPYGELRSGTPPVMVGSDRQVSSGNDFGDLSAGVGDGQAAKRYFSFGKRNVSGKVAEEGRGDWAVGWAR